MPVSGHLRVLIAAAMDHLGCTTNEATLTLHNDDEAIRFVRMGRKGVAGRLFARTQRHNAR